MPQRQLQALPAGRVYDAVCLGLNACDHLCLIPHFPQRGSKTQMKTFLTCGGGQSATAACALARLGHRVAYLGARGDDKPGELAGPWLREFGVDTSGLMLKPGSASQEAFIMVEEGGGERTIVWRRDPACSLEPGDLDPGLIASARVLHLDGYFLEASLEAARIAKRYGVIISMDGEKILPGCQELVAMCDVLMGCQDFAQRLCGMDSPQKALRELARMGPAWVGRTMGEQGSEMYCSQGYLRQPAFAVRSLDTTGAGDVFHAGMVHAVLQGQGPAQALLTASALAAMSTTALGGRSALPGLSELQAFIESRI